MDARSPGDACDGRGACAVLGELIEGRGQHGVADVFTAPVGYGGVHRQKLIASTLAIGRKEVHDLSQVNLR